MKFFKLLQVDMQRGVVKQYKKYLLFSIFILLAWYDFSLKLQISNVMTYSLGDCLYYVYGGIKEYVPSPNEEFVIPYLWLLNHIVILFFTLHYMYDDLIGFGQQFIYRSESRTLWWLAKCVCNMMAVLLFYILAWGMILVLLAVNQQAIGLDISEFMSQFMIVGEHQIIGDVGQGKTLLLETIILPCFVTIAISLMQMFLCLLVKPIVSYLISVIILIASTYYMNPFFVGSYAMAIRSNQFITNGFDGFLGVLYAIGLGIVSILGGLWVFRRYNILNSKE